MHLGLVAAVGPHLGAILLHIPLPQTSPFILDLRFDSHPPNLLLLLREEEEGRDFLRDWRFLLVEKLHVG